MNMFCSNCGTKLIADANFCFKCGKPLEDSLENVKRNKEIKFTILNRSITFSRDVIDYNGLYIIFKECYNESIEEFDNFYYDKVHNLDDVIEKAFPQIAFYLEKTLKMAISILVKNGIEHYNIEKLYEKSLPEIDSKQYLKPLLNDIEDIEITSENLRGYRSEERSNRSVWQGGGFGIGGAVKGAFIAGALNVGTGILRGMGDLLTDIGDKQKIIDLQNMVFKKDQTIECCRKAIFKGIYSILDSSYSVLVEEEIFKKVNLDDQKIRVILENRVENYFSNVNNGNKVSYENILDTIFEGLQRNPYRFDYFKTLCTIVENKTLDLRGQILQFCMYFSRVKQYDTYFKDEREKLKRTLIQLPENSSEDLIRKLNKVEEVLSKDSGMEIYTLLANLKEKKFLNEKEEKIIKWQSNKRVIDNLIDRNLIYKVWEEVGSNNLYAEYAIEKYYLRKVCGDIINRGDIKAMNEVIEEIEKKYSTKGVFTEYLVSSIEYEMYDVHKEYIKNMDEARNKIIDCAKRESISAILKSIKVGLKYLKDYNNDKYSDFNVLKGLLETAHPLVFLNLARAYERKYEEKKAQIYNSFYVKYLGNDEVHAENMLIYERMLEAERKEMKEMDEATKLCFITTAVCQSFGKEDECYELMSFRKFRDEWLMNEPDGPALITQYYEVAPKIVERIDSRENKDLIYREIWDKYLKECLDAIECNNLILCKNIYMEMVYTLSKEYIVSNVSN